MPKYMPKMEGFKSKDGTVGLNYPLLTKSNYTAWSIKMQANMQAHGIWSAIENADPKAVVDEKIDNVAKATIFQAIPDDILLSLAEKKTAKEVWTAIKTMCLGAERVKQAKIQTLKTEFENMCMKDTEQIDEYSLKLNGLVTNIRALGENMEETYVVKKLLRSVPPRFLQIASAIEQFGKLDEMSIEETVGSLKAHEERVRGQTESTGRQLLLTEEEWSRRENGEGQLLFTKEEWMRRANKGGTETL